MQQHQPDRVAALGSGGAEGVRHMADENSQPVKIVVLAALNLQPR